jgi:Na+/proline symporter
LLAAYVSTISTHLNWGTSYLVHDFYRRFLRPGADERHYVLVGRVVTVGLMIAAALLTTVLGSARRSFDLMLSVGAGTGLLYLLRWFWWRINAWSEIAAMASSFVIAAALFVAGTIGFSMPTDMALIATVALSTLVWMTVALTTSPTDPEVLRRFYRSVRPAGPGWAAVRRSCGDLPPAENLGQAFVGWVAGCAFVYSALFGAGQLLVGEPELAVLFVVVFIVSGLVLGRVVRQSWAR